MLLVGESAIGFAWCGLAGTWPCSCVAEVLVLLEKPVNVAEITEPVPCVSEMSALQKSSFKSALPSMRSRCVMDLGASVGCARAA